MYTTFIVDYYFITEDAAENMIFQPVGLLKQFIFYSLLSYLLSGNSRSY